MGKPPTREEIDAQNRRNARAMLYAAYLRHRRGRGQGDMRALIEAVWHCGARRVPPPKWVWQAFERAHHKLRRGDARSFDEAFGNKPREGRSPSPPSLWFALDVWSYVKNRVEAGMTQEVSLEQAAEAFKIGRTACGRIYRNIEHLNANHAKVMSHAAKRW